jgi:hypothetical protein
MYPEVQVNTSTYSLATSWKLRATIKAYRTFRIPGPPNDRCFSQGVQQYDTSFLDAWQDSTFRKRYPPRIQLLTQ